ncbi:MAG TPA: hypothetical protein VE396_09505 [Xanthobacteraceae bacterium]|jgi:hypothetical protein|nr:hypothetical protein [Xanthobacteraceae bacterium]
MLEIARQPANAHLHDVYFTVQGASRLVWRNPNHGITVGDDGLSWRVNDNPQTAPFANIVAIHLNTAALGNANNVIDQCKIEFNDGQWLAASNAAASGLPNDAQTPVYRDFVRDLHARLFAGGHDGISFLAGMTSWRYKTLFAALIVAALLFILTPLVLVFITGDPHAFIPMAMGAVLLWPFARLMRNNAPRSYTPDALPDELLS